MIDYFRGLPQHARIVALLVIGSFALLFLYAAITLSSWFFEHHNRIRDVVPRIARLHGYVLSEDVLRESAARAQEQLADITYPASQDSASVGTAVQQQLRSFMEAAGFNVTGSQLLAARAHDGFEEVRVDLSGTGEMDAVDQLLLELDSARPLLLIRSLAFQPVRVRRGEDPQRVQFSISVSAVRLL